MVLPMSTDLSTPTIRGGSGRRAATVWLVLAAFVGGAVLVLWVAGGFATDARPLLGRQMEVGEFASTRFWDVAVLGAEVSPDVGEVFVGITAVNKQRESALQLTDFMLAVRLPSGKVLLRSSCQSLRGDRFSPRVPTDALCSFRYERNELSDADFPAPGPLDIEVVVFEQRMSDGLLENPRPEVSAPIAWVPVHAQVVVGDL